MRCALLLFASAALIAGQPDSRELVRQSDQNGERSWQRSFDYFCTKRDVDRQLDSAGRVRNVDDDVYRVIPLGYGTSYEQPITHDNEPVRADVKLKSDKELARLESETAAQKQRRFLKLAAERSYMAEVPDAFDFKITGVENLPTGPAWVVRATPRPGYQAHSRYGRMFHAMRGTLWIDQKDRQWVKADAIAMDTVSFGFFIARLSRGSHIVLEQMRLPDGAWVPARIEARASARTFLFFDHNFEEDITYSGYRPGPTLAARR
jgi:hypothetical protein